MAKRARGAEEALAAAAASAAGAPLPPPKAPVVKNGGKCEHNREKRLCRECGGWAICEHNRRKSYCKECGGSAICEHSRQRSKCKDCGGAALRKCEHGKLKTSRCKRCREASMCQHKQKRKRCSECAPFRDLGVVGIAVEAHELLSLLERSSLPYASHPRRAEIAEKMARLRAFAYSHAPAPVQPEQPPLPTDDVPPQPPAPQMSQEQYQHMMAAPPNFPQFAVSGVHAMAGPPMPQAGGAQPGQAPHPFNPYYPPPWGFGNHLYQSSFPAVRHRREGEKSRKTAGRPSLKAAAVGESKKKRGKCKHNRERRLCKECGGWALCEHNRRKSHCKDCRGSAICQHDRQKTQCKDCGGSAICKHKRRKIRCKECTAEAQAAVDPSTSQHASEN